MGFAENLKKIREQNSLSQQDVANYLKITRQAYTNYELGKREPDISTLRQLCQFYNVPADMLIFGDNSQSDKAYAPIDKDSIKKLNLMNEIDDLSSQSKKDLKKYIELLKLRDRQEKK